MDCAVLALTHQIPTAAKDAPRGRWDHIEPVGNGVRPFDLSKVSTLITLGSLYVDLDLI